MENRQTLPTVHMRPADVAKLVRADLKEKFPKTKFSVRTRTTGTLDIEWTDGPPTRAVNDYTRKYVGQTFDGMQDLREYTNAGFVGDLAGQQVYYNYGTSFVFTHRNVSPEVMEATRLELGMAIAIESERFLDEVLADHHYWQAPQVYMREVEHGPWEASLYILTHTIIETRAAKEMES